MCRDRKTGALVLRLDDTFSEMEPNDDATCYVCGKRFEVRITAQRAAEPLKWERAYFGKEPCRCTDPGGECTCLRNIKEETAG